MKREILRHMCMRLITEHQGSRRRKREEIHRTNSKLPVWCLEDECLFH